MSSNLKKLPFSQRVENRVNYTFQSWGIFVSRNPCSVAVLSLIFFISLSTGMNKRTELKDQRLAWTPKDNPSIWASQRSMELFPSKGGAISFIVQSKS